MQGASTSHFNPWSHQKIVSSLYQYYDLSKEMSMPFIRYLSRSLMIQYELCLLPYLESCVDFFLVNKNRFFIILFSFEYISVSFTSFFIVTYQDWKRRAHWTNNNDPFLSFFQTCELFAVYFESELSLFIIVLFYLS